MRLQGFLTWFPSILEAKDDNYFEPVTVQKPGENKPKEILGEDITVTDVTDNPKHISSTMLPEVKQHMSKQNSRIEKKLNKKYQYLSSHMVETNGHVLGLYKRLKSLEEDHFKRMQAEIERLAEQMDQLEDKSVLNASDNSGQLNTQTDIVYLYHKLEKMSEKVAQLETKLKERREVSHSYVPILSNQPNGKTSMPELCFSEILPSSSSNTVVTLQSNLMKFMLPSVVTVTAVVINMYLYLTSARKFPL